MPEIKVNVKFAQKQIKKWKETEKRAEHVFDRMKLRGIGVNEIIEAVQCGAKLLEKDGKIIAVHRWYKIVYREFKLNGIRKIYPITVYAKLT